MAAAVLLSCSDARACELSLVTPATSALKNPVEAHVSLADDALVARFSVLAPTLNAKKVLGPNDYPYQFDVVELFVTFSDSGFPYYEFEVSPYNQNFQVRIVSAKQHHSVGTAIPQRSVEISIRFWGRGERAAIGVRSYPKQRKRISTSRNIFKHCRRVGRAYIYISTGSRLIWLSLRPLRSVPTLPSLEWPPSA
jgi:hypothetical protein